MALYSAKRVVIESPFGRNPDGTKSTADEYARNAAYVQRALRDSLVRKEAPFALHAFYPMLLDDTKESERRLGMECGFSWGFCASVCAVYSDYGITQGMLEGIVRASRNGIPIEQRSIGKNSER